MTDPRVSRAYDLLDDALSPETSDPWWMVDEAKDELEEVIEE